MKENCGPESAGPADSDRSHTQPGKCPPGHFSTEDDYNEWELGIGNLIIDLDADIEKTHSSPENNKAAMASSACTTKSSTAKPHSPMQSHPETGPSSSLKMKIKTTRRDDKSKEVKHEIVLTNDETHKATPHSKSKGKGDKDRPQSAGHKEKRDKPAIVRVSEATNGSVKSVSWPSDSSYINRSGEEVSSDAISRVTIDHPSDSSPALRKDTGTSTSVGTITEPECLGPCEPGTSVTLEGIVWQETDGGVLVVNVTWREKSYVGTLLDCTKHDWAPPRLCDSPEDSEMKVGKSRGKRGRAVVVEVKKATKGGRRTQNSGFTMPTQPSPAKSVDSKRKQATRSEEPPSPGGKRSRSRNESGLSDSTPASSTSTSGSASPALIECPEPNCSKKYKHINGLKYHQSHAHSEAPLAVKLEPADEPEAEEASTGNVTPMDTTDAVDNITKQTPPATVLQVDTEKDVEDATPDGHCDSSDAVKASNQETNPSSPAYSDISDANDNENGQDAIEEPRTDLASNHEAKPYFSPFSFRREEGHSQIPPENTAGTTTGDSTSSSSSSLNKSPFPFAYGYSFGDTSTNGNVFSKEENNVKEKQSENRHILKERGDVEKGPMEKSAPVGFCETSATCETNASNSPNNSSSTAANTAKGGEVTGANQEEGRKDVGVKPTMETTGPPPAPTSGFYLHPLNTSYLQPGVPFPHPAFSPGHPELGMFRGVPHHPIFNSHLTRFPGQAPPTAVPPEVTKKPSPTSLSYSNHKLNDGPSGSSSAPATASSSSSSSSPNSTAKLDSPSSKSIGNEPRRDSPPPQRHLHTHHHTHVGFPIYDPYGGKF